MRPRSAQYDPASANGPTGQAGGPPSATYLLLGGAAVFSAAFLGGATGFGYALVATPLLLVIGFPLTFVVTANLSLALVTRISLAYRFREHIDRPRSSS